MSEQKGSVVIEHPGGKARVVEREDGGLYFEASINLKSRLDIDSVFQFMAIAFFQWGRVIEREGPPAAVEREVDLGVTK